MGGELCNMTGKERKEGEYRTWHAQKNKTVGLFSALLNGV